ncbi:hypothetical protein [Campylobacter sp. RM5004]|uniref:hypothetical protein n=1 Tax=Campylobacter sp. RM5004 TaxID=1660078 RepID=UPI001EFAE57C|nr:hypothetical protein [Campylobacter sp. RM5004]
MSYICSCCGRDYCGFAGECGYSQEGVHVYVRKNSIPVCRYCCAEGEYIFKGKCRNSPSGYHQSM